MQFRYFSCPECNIVMCAPKRRNTKMKYYGQPHRKTMWCFKCKKKQQFILKEAITYKNSIFY